MGPVYYDYGDKYLVVVVFDQYTMSDMRVYNHWSEKTGKWGCNVIEKTNKNDFETFEAAYEWGLSQLKEK